MELAVDIYILNRDGEDEKVGEVRFNGEKITTSSTSGSSMLLTRIASVPIGADSKHINPENEPERFVRNLWRHYRSPYLRAMKARET